MDFSKAGSRHPEYQYLDLLSHILEFGEKKIDRTGVGTLSVFGTMMRFDVSKTLPILTTKRVYWKTAAKELLWFLTGDTNIQSLVKANCSIWTDWPLDKYRKATGLQITQQEFEALIVADDDFAATWGDLGPVYGKQWRRWLGADGREHDQIATLLDTIRNNPASRRMLFHAWNVAELEEMSLPPCHLLYQWQVSNLTFDAQGNPCGSLNLLMSQRSVDCYLGLPFNLANSAFLLRMVAHQTGLNPGEIVWTGGDTHIYLNHLEQVREQLARDPRPFPTMEFARKPESIDGYKIEDFIVEGYDPHPPIKAEVAV